ncbi:hypothetical protein Y025_2405 [Burkholderia pseudomallei TSV32]|nr:hypothetical protein Y025_2405 [Burkholderia pseudomallei TSV32]
MIGVIIGFSPVRLVFEMLDERAGSPPSGPAGLVAALDPKSSVDGIRSVSPPACPVFPTLLIPGIFMTPCSNNSRFARS